MTPGANLRASRILSLWLVLLLFVMTATGGSACVNRNDSDGVSLASTDQFDALLYYDTFNGELSLPNLPSRSVTEEEWRRLVTTQRANGLGSLTAAERSILLQGAVKSYLRLVSGTERVVEVSGVGSAHATERYSSDDSLFTVLDSREQKSSGILTAWSDTVYRVAGDHRDVSFVTRTGDDFAIEGWTSVDEGPLACDKSTDDVGLRFLAYFYYSTLTAIAEEGAKVVGRETIQRRRMEVLEQAFGNAELRVWLDERSLFPLRFQSPELRDSRGDELQPAKLITVTEINPDRPVSRPDEPCDG